MNKLIRRPTIGLALGGGGARGLAHIGVLEVFEREKIPIDCIVGTSMGGIIAALYSAGLSPEQLTEVAHYLSNVRNILKFVDITPPQRGIIKTDRIRAYIASLLGDCKDFENLRIPIALTAVDMRTKKVVYLTQGSVVDACMATSAVPGLFPPVEVDSKLLVDGGVLNNVPANAVRKMGAEFVIAVDVNYRLDQEHTWVDLPKDSLIRKFLPAFALDLYQAELIMTSTITEINLSKARPDIILNPPVPPDVNIFFGFTHALDTIQHGIHVAEEQIEKIIELTKPKLRLLSRSIDPSVLHD